ncbi:hypothetical protein ABW19_dt0206968 [Dactylella cylindrospora]|nr:hypothetical protein ABW19_dt0206968 [Dactylella cylindrospora]
MLIAAGVINGANIPRELQVQGGPTQSYDVRAIIYYQTLDCKLGNEQFIYVRFQDRVDPRDTTSSRFRGVQVADFTGIEYVDMNGYNSYMEISQPMTEWRDLQEGTITTFTPSLRGGYHIQSVTPLKFPPANELLGLSLRNDEPRPAISALRDMLLKIRRLFHGDNRIFDQLRQSYPGPMMNTKAQEGTGRTQTVQIGNMNHLASLNAAQNPQNQQSQQSIPGQGQTQSQEQNQAQNQAQNQPQSRPQSQPQTLQLTGYNQLTQLNTAISSQSRQQPQPQNQQGQQLVFQQGTQQGGRSAFDMANLAQLGFYGNQNTQSQHNLNAPQGGNPSSYRQYQGGGSGNMNQPPPGFNLGTSTQPQSQPRGQPNISGMQLANPGSNYRPSSSFGSMAGVSGGPGSANPTVAQNFRTGQIGGFPYSNQQPGAIQRQPWATSQQQLGITTDTDASVSRFLRDPDVRGNVGGRDQSGQQGPGISSGDVSDTSRTPFQLGYGFRNPGSPRQGNSRNSIGNTGSIGLSDIPNNANFPVFQAPQNRNPSGFGQSLNPSANTQTQVNPGQRQPYGSENYHTMEIETIEQGSPERFPNIAGDTQRGEQEDPAIDLLNFRSTRPILQHRESELLYDWLYRDHPILGNLRTLPVSYIDPNYEIIGTTRDNLVRYINNIWKPEMSRRQETIRASYEALVPGFRASIQEREAIRDELGVELQKAYRLESSAIARGLPPTHRTRRDITGLIRSLQGKMGTLNTEIGDIQQQWRAAQREMTRQDQRLTAEILMMEEDLEVRYDLWMNMARENIEKQTSKLINVDRPNPQ